MRMLRNKQGRISKRKALLAAAALGVGGYGLYKGAGAYRAALGQQPMALTPFNRHKAALGSVASQAGSALKALPGQVRALPGQVRALPGQAGDALKSAPGRAKSLYRKGRRYARRAMFRAGLGNAKAKQARMERIAGVRAYKNSIAGQAGL